MFSRLLHTAVLGFVLIADGAFRPVPAPGVLPNARPTAPPHFRPVPSLPNSGYVSPLERRPVIERPPRALCRSACAESCAVSSCGNRDPSACVKFRTRCRVRCSEGC